MIINPQVKNGEKHERFSKKLEDNYLTFITAAAASVALIAVFIWATTVFMKKIKNK